MRGAAQQQDPAAPDLAGGHAAALAECRELLRDLRGRPSCERLVTELVELELRLSALRIAYEDSTAAASCTDVLIGLGRKLERAAQSCVPVPAPPRPRRQSRQLPLMQLLPST